MRWALGALPLGTDEGVPYILWHQLILFAGTSRLVCLMTARLNTPGDSQC
jgi:hypothetical protein